MALLKDSKPSWAKRKLPLGARSGGPRAQWRGIPLPKFTPGQRRRGNPTLNELSNAIQGHGPSVVWWRRLQIQRPARARALLDAWNATSSGGLHGLVYYDDDIPGCRKCGSRIRVALSGRCSPCDEPRWNKPRVMSEYAIHQRALKIHQNKVQQEQPVQQRYVAGHPNRWVMLQDAAGLQCWHRGVTQGKWRVLTQHDITRLLQLDSDFRVLFQHMTANDPQPDWAVSKTTS